MADVRSFWRVLQPTSVLHYIFWRLTGKRSEISLRLHDGPRILLRPPLAGANNDYGVAYEIFVHRFYAPLRPLTAAPVRLIVDLGANVGFSCIYWLALFPEAQVIAVEPHPGHVAQCRANLAANGMLSKVTLHAAAAGTTPGRITLSDEGTSSALLSEPGDGIQADMLDIFELLAGRTVDLLKIDIEGGEYAILADPRFLSLRVASLVMEWHGGPAKRDWCLARLDEAGYETVKIFDQGSSGMLWAFRRATADTDRARSRTPLNAPPVAEMKPC